MVLKPPSAEDAKQTFIEKVQDPIFAYLISFLILYLDVAIHFITRKNLLQFRFSDIENSIPIGKVIVAIPPYFLILYMAPKVHFWLKYACVSSHLDWILEKLFPNSWGSYTLKVISKSDIILLQDVKSYALRKNEQVLYQFVLSEEQRDSVLWKMASICLAFWVLTIVEMSFRGFLLNDLFSHYIPKSIGAVNTTLLQIFVFILAICQIFIQLGPPHTGWVYLPAHPLSEEKEKRLQDAEKAKMEQYNLKLKAARPNVGRPGE